MIVKRFDYKVLVRLDLTIEEVDYFLASAESHYDYTVKRKIPHLLSVVKMLLEDGDKDPAWNFTFRDLDLMCKCVEMPMEPRALGMQLYLNCKLAMTKINAERDRLLKETP